MIKLNFDQGISILIQYNIIYNIYSLLALSSHPNNTQIINSCHLPLIGKFIGFCVTCIWQVVLLKYLSPSH